MTGGGEGASEGARILHKEVSEKFNPVNHFFGTEHNAKHPQLSNEVAHCVAFLMAVDDPVVSSAFLSPSRCDLKKISVMREDSRLFCSGVVQLFFVGEAQIPSVSGGKGIHAPSFQTICNGNIDAFVCVDPESARSLCDLRGDLFLHP